MPVKISHEGKRGCGWRKPGLYLMSDEPLAPCGRLPIPLDSCPVCGEGIKPARGWTWITADLIRPKLKAKGKCLSPTCPTCPLRDPDKLPFERAGLLWVGARFYRDPAEFMAEAKTRGISRRINFLPHGFKVGETWVFLAHCHALGQDKAGIFTVFRPQRVEQVVRGDEPEAEIKMIEKRGFVPVIVQRQEGNSVEDEGL